MYLALLIDPNQREPLFDKETEERKEQDLLFDWICGHETGQAGEALKRLRQGNSYKTVAGWSANLSVALF